MFFLRHPIIPVYSFVLDFVPQSTFCEKLGIFAIETNDKIEFDGHKMLSKQFNRTQVNQISQFPKGNSDTFAINAITTSVVDETDMSVCYTLELCIPDESPRLIVPTTICKQDVMALLDSGSQLTIITETLANSLNAKVTTNSVPKACAANKTYVPLIGRTFLQSNVCGYDMMVNYVIAKEGVLSHDVILGTDFMRFMNKNGILWAVDLNKRLIQFGDNCLALTNCRMNPDKAKELARLISSDSCTDACHFSSCNQKHLISSENVEAILGKYSFEIIHDQKYDAMNPSYLNHNEYQIGDVLALQVAQSNVRAKLAPFKAAFRVKNKQKFSDKLKMQDAIHFNTIRC